MKKTTKKPMVLFMTVTILFVLLFFKLERKLYVNLTSSMPIGIYKKLVKNTYEIGDIIVFYHDEKRGDLIKYLSALPGDEYCIDYRGVLFINNMPQAALNIQKYGEYYNDQSFCNLLKKGEMLVLGDHPDSYDSRYFGPRKEEKVIAKVSLLIQLNDLKIPNH